MKGLRLALVLGAALAGGIASTAQAMPVTPLGAEVGNADLLQNVQFFFGGQEYCWYWDGWRGPGWYWCGYEWRSGFGWGGPSGWHRWRVPGRGLRPGPNLRPVRPGGPGGMVRPGGPGRPGGHSGGPGGHGGRPGGHGGRPGGHGGGGGGRGGGGRQH
jgi:hypothetical protein